MRTKSTATVLPPKLNHKGKILSSDYSSSSYSSSSYSSSAYSSSDEEIVYEESRLKQLDDEDTRQCQQEIDEFEEPDSDVDPTQDIIDPTIPPFTQKEVIYVPDSSSADDEEEDIGEDTAYTDTEMSTMRKSEREEFIRENLKFFWNEIRHDIIEEYEKNRRYAYKVTTPHDKIRYIKRNHYGYYEGMKDWVIDRLAGYYTYQRL